ncbi:hypothetical protein J2TS5_22390 [Bacillus licheniformis]|nr:hypothetical protein J2TS5_22390 [Bacillus licheniformis]
MKMEKLIREASEPSADWPGMITQRLVKSLPGKDRSNITIHDISKLRFIKLKCFKLIVARNNKGSETLSRGWFLKGLKKENKKAGVKYGIFRQII